MKILVICQYYKPEPFLINEIAPALVEQGHDVTVLTGLPNYPEGKVLSEYRFQKKRDEMLEGVRVIRCNEVGRNRGYVYLALNYVSYAITASIRTFFMREKFDAVLCYQLSPILMALPAIVYKQRHKVPLFLYCLDIWPESAQAHIKRDTGRIYRCIHSISKWIYRQCDEICVTSKPFMEYMEQKNDISADKLSYLPQHADARLLSHDFRKEESRIKHFMYAGNLGKGQTLDVIIRAAELLKERSDFVIDFVGDGSMLDSLKTLATECGIADKVIFHGRHTAASMAQFYEMADVLLITLRGNNFVGNTLPGKLQTYLTVGKPILGAINGAAVDAIAEAGCGKCVPAGDYKGLANLMQSYLECPGDYDECGKNAISFFRRNFTLKLFISGLEARLYHLAQQGENGS